MLSHLNTLEMVELLDLIHVFRLKNAYQARGQPQMVKLTVALSSKEVHIAEAMGGEDVASLRDITQEMLVSQEGVQRKQGQAAATGMERGVQSYLEGM